MSKIGWVRGRLIITWFFSIRSPLAIAMILLPVFFSVGASYYISRMVLAFFQQNMSGVAMAVCGVVAARKIMAISFDYIQRNGDRRSRESTSSVNLRSEGEDLTEIVCSDGKLQDIRDGGGSKPMSRDVTLCRHCRRRPIVLQDEDAVYKSVRAAARNSNLQPKAIKASSVRNTTGRPSVSESAAVNIAKNSFSSVDEEEKVCKTVFESSSSDRALISDPIAAFLNEFCVSADEGQTMLLDVEGRNAGRRRALESYDEEVDEDAVDVKHQILPLSIGTTAHRDSSSNDHIYRCGECCCDPDVFAAEACSCCLQQDGIASKGTNNSDASAATKCCRTSTSTSGPWPSEQQLITDAELQKAAAEYYTLEGDVLWTRPYPGKQKPISSNHEYMADRLCNSTFDNDCHSRMRSQELNGGSGKLESVISSSNIITGNDDDPDRKGEFVAGLTHHRRATMKQPLIYESARGINVDEDMLIDLKLRAIASTPRSNGDESNYMSTAGSFRDVGSFRELHGHETTWCCDQQLRNAVFDNKGEQAETSMHMESGSIIGCCDSRERPCMTHCRSRSKVLQTDPLLSIASLAKEQEIMDVLWQEQDEHHRNVDCRGQSRYGYGSTSNDVNGSRSSSDVNPDPYKVRGYNHQSRRRSFIGICSVLRELGLKQCLQSSRVDS